MSQVALDPTCTPGTPCPDCGSQARVYALTVVDYINFHDKVRLRAKEEGAKKPHLEVTKGDSFHCETQKWNQMERVIDWLHDRYFERFTDPETGTVLHLCDEPLSEHWGHGSAKMRRTEPKH